MHYYSISRRDFIWMSCMWWYIRAANLEGI